jgi:Glycosyltransferase Family 4
MEKLAVELAKLGCNLDVVTYHDSSAGTETRREGFRVHRVTNAVQTHLNIVTWALALNTEFQRVAADIAVRSADDEKLVHASEWLCVPAAIQLKKTIGVPFVLSLHSIESERSGGSGGPLTGAINYLEKEGCLESSKILLARTSTAETLQKLYTISNDKITIIDFNKEHDVLNQYESVLQAGLTRTELTSD